MKKKPPLGDEKGQAKLVQVGKRHDANTEKIAASIIQL